MKKKFYTTCYARIQKLPTGSNLVRTSNGSPRYFAHIPMMFVKEFTPEAFVKRLAWPEPFTSDYKAQLERGKRSGKIQHVLETLPEGSVFLCFEGDWNQCHRKILADWLNANFDVEVTEYFPPGAKPPGPKPKPINPQMSFLL